MIKKTCIIAVVGLFMTSFFLVAEKINVTGSWKFNAQGKKEREIELIQDGEKLTVIWLKTRKKSIIYKGTIIGNAISWTAIRSTGQKTVHIHYEGTVNVDQMSGTSSKSSTRAQSWTARRVMTEK